ncbi:toll/interleukin-1 receptor-like protein [Eucalyptus grandis]|uniref:toll/interleukin-1 receptor-like protein n=1 Tax=Eucalyptus grandis TaxID=71139 RepID=UPI00192EEAE6|nr:toll/interleukin-1 receptor-like protein [Eucalyptus grandis]
MARASEGGYDVFLSFSGNDTRHDFVRLLRDALVGAKLRVFLDESEIKVGDEIAKKILQAIDDSKIYIPIISETYPDSKWCLIELAHMMNDVSQAESSKRIFPIFYKLKPAEVEARTPRPQNPSSEVELRAFKEALAKVGGIKGWKVEELHR